MLKQLTTLTAAIMLSASAWATSTDTTDIAALTQKADAGDVEAQLSLAGHYHQAKDFGKAFIWAEKAAKQGDPKGQTNLAMLYRTGKGVPLSYQKAIEWYTKAADQNYASAQYNLGVMHEYGDGVKENLSTAKAWYGKACDNGHQGGCDAYRELQADGY